MGGDIDPENQGWDLYHIESGVDVSLPENYYERYLTSLHIISLFVREIFVRAFAFLILIVFSSSLTILFSKWHTNLITPYAARSDIWVTLALTGMFYFAVFTTITLIVQFWRLGRWTNKGLKNFWARQTKVRPSKSQTRLSSWGIAFDHVHSSIFSFRYEIKSELIATWKYRQAIIQAFLGALLFLFSILALLLIIDADILQNLPKFGKSPISLYTAITSLVIGRVPGLILLMVSTFTSDVAQTVIVIFVFGGCSIFVAPSAYNFLIALESLFRLWTKYWFDGPLIQPRIVFLHTVCYSLIFAAVSYVVITV